jgi:hypothetical protein
LAKSQSYLVVEGLETKVSWITSLDSFNQAQTMAFAHTTENGSIPNCSIGINLYTGPQNTCGFFD